MTRRRTNGPVARQFDIVFSCLYSLIFLWPEQWLFKSTSLHVSKRTSTTRLVFELMLSHSNKPLTSTRESNESRKEEGKDREEETPWITSGRIGMAVRLIAIGFIDKWPNLEANREAKRGDWQSIKMNNAPLSAFWFSCVSSYEWS